MPSEFRHHWDLDPAVTFLNHGSFGATPRAVLDAQTAWRRRMEAEPVRFFSDELEPAMDDARRTVAAFLGADPEGLAFLPNATTAVNTALRSLPLRPGDEVLVHDQAYNAVRNAAAFVAEAGGARVVTAAVPFPLAGGPDDIEAAILGAVTPHTRAAVIDHIASATAVVSPVERLVPALQARGVIVIVDGAHAPGQVVTGLDALGADFYAGNLHKWVCGPKGSGFLWTRPDRQPKVRPLVISHGANSPRTDRSAYRLEFDWLGTLDPSPYLAAADAVTFIGDLMAGGWEAVRRRNHELAVAGRRLLLDRLKIDSPAPEEMLGSMASVPLAVERGPFVVQGIALSADPIQAALIREHGIQAMITPWPQRPTDGPWRRIVRISAALHNDLDQMAALADALANVLAARNN